jgi:hypothetical protein
MILMLTPSSSEIEGDKEVNEWVKEFRDRLQTFTKTYPQFSSVFLSEQSALSLSF